MKFFLILISFLWSVSSLAMAENQAFEGPVIIKNKAFVYQNNPTKRFYIRGVTYQSQDRVDDLRNENIEYFKEHVLPMLKAMNINTIRVYQVEIDEKKPTQRHGKIMRLLRDNGIYVMVGLVTNKKGLNNEEYFLNRVDPQYNHLLRGRLQTVINAFAKYDNVLAFSVGNEVVWPGSILGAPGVDQNVKMANDLMGYDALAMKLMIADAKMYIRQADVGRMIPVGMAIQDTPMDSAPDGMVGNVDVVAQYYACGDPDNRADFIGYNTYAYLPGGPSQAYDRFNEYISRVEIPGVFTESGAQNANDPKVRDWRIVEYITDNPDEVKNLAGHFAFRLMQRCENLGLYQDEYTKAQNNDSNSGENYCAIQPDKLSPYSPTNFGGSDDLANVYGRLMRPDKFPSIEQSATTATTQCTGEYAVTKQGKPITAKFNPGYINKTITVYNYATHPIILIQNSPEAPNGPGRTYGFVDASDGSTPVAKEVGLTSESELVILKPSDNYPFICNVSKDMLKESTSVANNVSWGQPCNVNVNQKKK